MSFTNLFCIYGVGFCAPEPEPEPEPGPDPSFFSSFNLFGPEPFTLELKGGVTLLNLDLIVALLLCALCSSLVATCVTYYWIKPKLEVRVRRSAKAEPVPGNTPSGPLGGDDGDEAILPHGKSMLECMVHGVNGYYQRPPSRSNKIPILSLTSVKDSVTVLFKSIGFLTGAKDAEDGATGRNGDESEGSILGLVEKMKRQVQIKPQLEKFTERECPPSSDFGVLTLHQYPRGRSIPCLAPHGMKIESLLRLCKIPHKVVFDADDMGPWLSYGDLKVCGGVQMCIKFLNQTFPRKMKLWAVPMNKKVPAWFVVVLADCHLYWGLALWRWWLEAGKEDEENPAECDVLYGDTRDNSEVERVATWLLGIGQMSQAEILKAIKDDLVALAASLGDKKYFIGDSMTEVDCSVFSLLSQMVWASRDSPFRRLIKKYPSLIRFSEGIRNELWGDWDTLVVDSEVNVPVPNQEERAEAKKALKSARSESGSHEPRRSRPNPQPPRRTDKISIKSSSRAKRSSKSQTRRSTPLINPVQPN